MIDKEVWLNLQLQQMQKGNLGEESEMQTVVIEMMSYQDMSY